MNDSFVEVHAGRRHREPGLGLMLLRMYVRWAEQHGYKVEFQEEHSGEEAGIKSATISGQGPQCLWLAEDGIGVHRLVRISPYDSNARRHTSFSSSGSIRWSTTPSRSRSMTSDLRVDTYRASGAGGQHVNTTDSAVRITHIPTGIIVACQISARSTRTAPRAMEDAEGAAV
jgi:peptide chain release factor 2